MAKQITRIENHLYLIVLSGTTTLEEISSLGTEITRLSEEHGEEFYIEVVDMSQLHSIPFDLRGLRNIFAKTRIPFAVLMIRPPYLATMAANILGKVSNLITEYHDTQEAAMARARSLIAQKAGVKSHHP